MASKLRWYLMIGLLLVAANVNAQSSLEQERLISDGIARRLHDDAKAVLQLSTNSAVPAAIQKEVAEKLKHIEEGIPMLPANHPENFRAILPLNALHHDIFAAQSAIWRGRGASGIVPGEANTWDPLTLIGFLPVKTQAQVNVAMMLNEFRSGAFNLSNVGEKDETVKLKITGLPGGDNPSWITVQEVEWTDTKSGQPIADALPQAQSDRDGFLIHLTSGLTRQVWFTFHPTNVPAGSYHGRVTVSGQAFEIPLNIKIYPMQLPAKLTLHVGGWDYTDRPGFRAITEANRPLVIAYLKEHFVDSPWATEVVLPAGEFGSDDQYVTPPNVSAFDEWQKSWRGAERYCVFMNVKDSFAGAKMGTPQFDKRVGNWMQFWAEHLKTRAVKPKQFFLLLVDEPSRADQDAVILAWAKAIHAVHTGVKVWEDPIHNDPAANEEMLGNCEVLCPNRVKLLENQKYRDYFTQQRPPRCELAFYSCAGPMPLLDPYTYIRLQAWTAWVYGARTSYFWAFSDCGGGSSWNEYAAPHADYVPFFIDKNSVTPSKHGEAFRESAEDYECFAMLRDALMRNGRKKNPVADHGRKLLVGAAQRVCQAPGAAKFGWAVAKDRGIADRARIEILDALSGLQDAK